MLAIHYTRIIAPPDQLIQCYISKYFVVHKYTFIYTILYASHHKIANSSCTVQPQIHWLASTHPAKLHVNQAHTSTPHRTTGLQRRRPAGWKNEWSESINKDTICTIIIIHKLHKVYNAVHKIYHYTRINYNNIIIKSYNNWHPIFPSTISNDCIIILHLSIAQMDMSMYIWKVWMCVHACNIMHTI